MPDFLLAVEEAAKAEASIPWIYAGPAFAALGVTIGALWLALTKALTSRFEFSQQVAAAREKDSEMRHKDTVESVVTIRAVNDTMLRLVDKNDVLKGQIESLKGHVR